MDDKIGDFLELEPLEQDITTANALVKDSKLDNDYEYARGNLYQVIEMLSSIICIDDYVVEDIMFTTYEVIVIIIKDYFDNAIYLI